MQGNVDVSVIIPIFNEAENLARLYAHLTKTLESLQYELCFVDDGSTDTSYHTLVDLHATDPRVKVIRLAGNFGQHAALSAGIEHATGQILVSFDADLQNDPQDILKLVAKIDEGHDVVSGWRVGRKGGLFTRRLPSWLANKSIALMTGARLHDATCPLKAVRREVAQNLASYGEMRRFLGALVLQLGRSIGEVQVSHRPRMEGHSKYSFLDLMGGYIDFITAFWPRPFQLVTVLGILCLLAGFLGGVLYLILRFPAGVAPGLRSQAVVFILVFVGFQFVILGLLGEFIARIYRLVQNRPLFVIREILE